MKEILKNAARTVAALALITLSTPSFGQGTNLIIDKFDPGGPFGTNGYSAGQITNIWWNWFGAAFQNVSWDPTMDANSNAASGSMKISANFPNGDQFVVWDQSPTNNFSSIINMLYGGTNYLNGFQFTNFQCDIRFASGSATTVNGTTTNYGHFQIGTRTADYGQTFFGNIEVPVGNTNWVHLSFPINPVLNPSLTNVYDLLVKIDGNWYQSFKMNGPTTLWIDNLQFFGGTNVGPVERPIVGPLRPATHALHIFAGDVSETYMREDIATAFDSESWYNNNSFPQFPYSFSTTFAGFPDKSYQGFRYNMFLIPSAYLPYAQYANSFADYDVSNMVAVRILANTTNYLGILEYKVNLPNANPNVTLATIAATNPVGTWTVTFNDNVSGVFIFGTNNVPFSIPSADAATFANPLVAYYGVEGDGTNNYFQGIDISRIQIGQNIDDTFSSPSEFTLDTGTWTTVASIPACVWLAEPGARYWLSWTVPEDVYSPFVSTNLSSGAGWLSPASYNGNTPLTSALISGQRWSLLLSNDVPASKNVFFSVRKSF